jgi:putative PIN family toxin of toxin-antitoxin system
MIVVIDTSVWISAIQFSGRHGKPGQAIERATCKATIAICPQIEEETRSVLTEKFGWSAEDASAVMAAWLPSPLRVTISGTIHVCRDPKDDMILECAAESGAQCIVTGDKDLLVLGSFRGIRILTPAEFLQENS